MNRMPMNLPSLAHPRIRAGLLLLSVALCHAAATADERTGEQIYKQACARCHGAAGEGTKKHPHALVGDKPVAALAKVIAETMPEDNPGSLDADGVKKVTAYVYDTFYSPVAQARNKPARVELAHLTVPQYRNAVADLIGSFRTPAKLDDRRGLRGEYFADRRFALNKRVIDRLDPEVRFDFGTNAPAEKDFDSNLFCIRWEGSVLAPETGEYEFLVRTDHAARLWVNNTKQPLIDAWVKSGKDTDYRATLFLIAGRAYPVRLEFAKAKQGVTDPKLNKPMTAPAMVSLLWKPPHGTLETLPARTLTPNKFPEAFVVGTPFPPDDRSLGWVRGTSVSKEWDAATTDAALETAAYVTGHLAELSGVPENASERPKKLRDFCRRFAERAFRRPLTDEQVKFFIDRQFEAAKDPEIAVKRVVLLVLLSPRFLYLDAGTGAIDGYDVACRLSFGLWDSLPDQELLSAAAAGKLGSRDEVATQARRMLNDPRAQAKLREFLHAWLRIDRVPEITKDSKRFPGFDAATAADLRTSLNLFLDDVAWGEKSDFRQLLLSDQVYLNGRLAKFYGAELPEDAGFETVTLDPGRRAGVLTHPYLLAAFAYNAESSPIHRGVFLARGVLGKPLRPPPDAFTPFAADLHPTLTTRERVDLQTKPQACIGCHGMINPLGFTLENFDAVGRFREQDNGKPVDSSGVYQTRSGEVVKFAGPRDLAAFLAGSEEVQESFTEQLFHHLVKQPVRAYGPKVLADLRRAFAKHEFSIRELMVEIVTVSALKARG
jgi:mono/diheme cytochrome c family protein